MVGWMAALENTRLEFSSQVFPEAGASKHNLLPVLPGIRKLYPIFLLRSEPECNEGGERFFLVCLKICLGK